MDHDRVERFTGLVCEERVDSARPDRIDYQIGWKPFWVALHEPLADEFRRVITEQARACQPVAITFDRETRRIRSVARTAFSLNLTEGPPPRPLKAPDADDPNAGLATDVAGA